MWLRQVVAGRHPHLTQFTLVNRSGPRVNRGVRRGGRTDENDVKSEDLPLNISRETECCLGKFSGFVRKKSNYKKFYE